MTRTPFAVALMQLLAETGLSQYGLGGRCEIEPPTISKWLTPVADPNHRNPTQAQVLQVFLAVATPPPVCAELLALADADDGEFAAALRPPRPAAAPDSRELGWRSGIGGGRLRASLAGEVRLTRAERLRLLVLVRCTPRQVALASRLLEAAGYYILRGREEDERWTA